MLAMAANVFEKIEDQRSNRNDLYFKVFCKFLSEKKSTKINTSEAQHHRRKHSFVYMELLNKSSYSTSEKSVTSLSDDVSLQQTETIKKEELGSVASITDSDMYLARIIPSRSRDNEHLGIDYVPQQSNNEIPENPELSRGDETPKMEHVIADEANVLFNSPTNEPLPHRKCDVSSVSLKDNDDVDFWNISESNLANTRLHDWVAMQHRCIIKELKCHDNSSNQHHLSQNDGAEFFPTLASIEEADERGFSENLKYNRKSFRGRSKSWSMDQFAKHSLETSLYKCKTFENLSSDECGNKDLHNSEANLDRLDIAEQVEASDSDKIKTDIFKSIILSEIKEEESRAEERSNCSTPATIKVLESEQSKNSSSVSLNNLTIEEPGSSTPINLEISVFEETEYPFAPKSEVPVLESSEGCCPLQPQNPPVIVVESLEDYVKTLIPERIYKSRTVSNHHSLHSSCTDSAYSSRERIDTLYLSTPDISILNYEDGIDFQYIPISYAEIKRQRKRNKVKRTVSDVHDSYYFSKETSTSKLNTLKKQLVRKISKRYRRPKHSQAEDSSETSSNQKSPEKQKKITKHSSFRGTMKRLFRHIRRRDNFKKYSLERRRTWSLPTQLDSCSGSDFYYATESEATT